MKVNRIIIFLIIITVIPSLLFAQEGLIPCNGVDCDFNSLVQLAKNFVNFLIVVSIPIAVIGFIVAGFMIMTAGPDASRVSKGKSLLIKIAVGFFFVLAAWLIVNLITSTLFVGGDAFNLIE